MVICIIYWRCGTLNDHGYKTNLEMLQRVSEFLLTLENQRKPSAKLLGTPSSVDDMYHHSGPSSLRVLILKSLCSIIKTPKYISYLLLRQSEINSNA